MNNYFLVFIISCVSCSHSPKKINYGNDSCHYCQMIIVSPPFATQIISKKGKVFTYDAIECMVQEHTKGICYINDYYTHAPILASNARFLIHDSIRSPMGGNIAGFKNHQNGITWNDVQDHFR